MRDRHTSTVLREADDRVLSATVEEVRALIGMTDTDEADILGIYRLRVAVEDLPTSSGGNVTQGVGRSSILNEL